MTSNKKTIISIIVIIVICLCVGIGYSYLNQDLSVEGKVTVDASKLHKKKAYDVVKAQSLGSSSTIDYNVSSQYAEENYTDADGYAHTAGVYQLEEDNNVYFYRGSVTNNNVLFANYCWKIVRTTTTGGVKMIYNGTPTDGQCTNTSSTSVGIEFNRLNDEAKYVGYTYDDGSGNQTDSTIKTYIDNWYNKNIISYTSYLEDTDYCNDRSVVSSTDAAYSNIYSPVSTYTYFGTYARAGQKSIEVKPTTVCPQNSDKYTVSSSNGNGLLIYPIGLLTSDEMALAGATSLYNSSGEKKYSLYTNSTYYLYNTCTYWGLSPMNFLFDDAKVGVVSSLKYLYGSIVDSSAEVRPVVSLVASVKFESSGDGTSTNPYVVSSK